MAARIVVRLFLSWARQDQALKDALVPLLKTNLRILDGIDVCWWEDNHIRIGDEWRPEIVSRLDVCNYGLLLLSPEFLASEFIRDVELPYFVGASATKGVIPVALKRVPLDGTRTLHGVDRHQVFGLGPQRRCFAELRGNDRERFAQELSTAIRARVVGDQ